MEPLVSAVNNLWDSMSKQAYGFAYWQYALATLVVLFVFKKPIKRFVKRQVRKVVRLAVKVARIYFIGM